MSVTPNDGGPAFPEHPLEHDHYWFHGTRGMSLLDYFAGQALANSSICHTDLSLKERIEDAYLHACEMLSYKQTVLHKQNQQAVSESQQVRWALEVMHE